MWLSAWVLLVVLALGGLFACFYKIEDELTAYNIGMHEPLSDAVALSFRCPPAPPPRPPLTSVGVSTGMQRGCQQHFDSCADMSFMKACCCSRCSCASAGPPRRRRSRSCCSGSTVRRALPFIDISLPFSGLLTLPLPFQCLSRCFTLRSCCLGSQRCEGHGNSVVLPLPSPLQDSASPSAPPQATFFHFASTAFLLQDGAIYLAFPAQGTACPLCFHCPSFSARQAPFTSRSLLPQVPARRRWSSVG